jgi:hypothetical protein
LIGILSIACDRIPFMLPWDESDCGVGGASEFRRRLRMFSMSTLRKGSGSFGSILSAASLVGEAGFEGVVNVT